MNKQAVIKMIGKNRWNEFEIWMTGQTVGISENGETDYYSWDVDRFLSGRDVVD